MYKYNKNIYK
jgi:hypothetical protein